MMNSASRPPSGARNPNDFEPNEDWTLRLKRRIQLDLATLIQEAKDKQLRELRKSDLSTGNKTRLEDEYRAAMAKIRLIANNQYQAELEKVVRAKEAEMELQKRALVALEAHLAVEEERRREAEERAEEATEKHEKLRQLEEETRKRECESRERENALFVLEVEMRRREAEARKKEDEARKLEEARAKREVDDARQRAEAQEMEDTQKRQGLNMDDYLRSNDFEEQAYIQQQQHFHQRAAQIKRERQEKLSQGTSRFSSCSSSTSNTSSTATPTSSTAPNSRTSSDTQPPIPPQGNYNSEEWQPRHEFTSQEQMRWNPQSPDDIQRVFERHERLWLKLAQKSDLAWNDFPWPVLQQPPTTPHDILNNAMSAYIHSPFWPDNAKATKDRIKDHMRKWYPDRFETKHLTKVMEAEREKVRQGMGIVFRYLCVLLRENGSSYVAGQFGYRGNTDSAPKAKKIYFGTIRTAAENAAEARRQEDLVTEREAKLKKMEAIINQREQDAQKCANDAKNLFEEIAQKEFELTRRENAILTNLQYQEEQYRRQKAEIETRAAINHAAEVRTQEDLVTNREAELKKMEEIINQREQDAEKCAADAKKLAEDTAQKKTELEKREVAILANLNYQEEQYRHEKAQMEAALEMRNQKIELEIEKGIARREEEARKCINDAQKFAEEVTRQEAWLKKRDEEIKELEGRLRQEIEKARQLQQDAQAIAENNQARFLELKNLEADVARLTADAHKIEEEAKMKEAELAEREQDLNKRSAYAKMLENEARRKENQATQKEEVIANREEKLKAEYRNINQLRQETHRAQEEAKQEIFRIEEATRKREQEILEREEALVASEVELRHRMDIALHYPAPFNGLPMNIALTSASSIRSSFISNEDREYFYQEHLQRPDGGTSLESQSIRTSILSIEEQEQFYQWQQQSRPMAKPSPYHNSRR